MTSDLGLESTPVVIGLGSNIGDRLDYLRRATSALERIAAIVSRSHVYETEPMGPEQAPFLNAALLLRSSLADEHLLDCMQDIERSLGRERLVRWGPRTVDLDLLWIEGRAVSTARLSVPHVRLRERAFALVPLLEVAPGASDPRTGEPLESFRGLAGGAIVRTQWVL